jgi:hypothetical protein
MARNHTQRASRFTPPWQASSWLGTMKKHGGGMGDRGNENGHTAALAMIDAFAGTGAARFDVTWTNAAGEKQKFRRDVLVADLRRTLPRMLDAAIMQRHNLIVRPHGPDVTFVQLDDLKTHQVAAVGPAALLILETSPDNFQAWVALPGHEDKDLARRLRKGTGADTTASGATRVAGSLNFKAKYAPNFPRVKVHAVQPGRTVTADELDRLGLVAAPEIVAQSPHLAPARVSPANRRWPSYAVCVDGAPLNSEETGPDLSRADFVWCMTAITWGWPVEDTAARLMEESPKAKAQGKTYAELTARNAGFAVDRRRQQPQRHQI